MIDLSDAQRDELRQLLAEREAVLQREVQDAGDADQEGPGPLSTEIGDAVEVGQNRFRAGMAHADKLRDQEELMAIDAARARMADGSYGECTDCGVAIPIERLRAQPTAERCVPCQEQFEKTHATTPFFSV